MRVSCEYKNTYSWCRYNHHDCGFFSQCGFNVRHHGRFPIEIIDDDPGILTRDLESRLVVRLPIRYTWWPLLRAIMNDRCLSLAYFRRLSADYWSNWKRMIMKIIGIQSLKRGPRVNASESHAKSALVTFMRD